MDLRDLPEINPNHLNERIGELETARKQMADAFTTLDKSAVAKLQEQRAHQDMKYPRRVFGELTQEANLIALSPVAIFDAARLWQTGLPPGQVRYALGGDCD